MLIAFELTNGNWLSVEFNSANGIRFGYRIGSSTGPWTYHWTGHQYSVVTRGTASRVVITQARASHYFDIDIDGYYGTYHFVISSAGIMLFDSSWSTIKSLAWDQYSVGWTVVRVTTSLSLPANNGNTASVAIPVPSGYTAASLMGLNTGDPYCVIMTFSVKNNVASIYTRNIFSGPKTASITFDAVCLKTAAKV